MLAPSWKWIHLEARKWPTNISYKFYSQYTTEISWLKILAPYRSTFLLHVFLRFFLLLLHLLLFLIIILTLIRLSRTSCSRCVHFRYKSDLHTYERFRYSVDFWRTVGQSQCLYLHGQRNTHTNFHDPDGIPSHYPSVRGVQDSKNTRTVRQTWSEFAVYVSVNSKAEVVLPLLKG